MPTRTFTVTPAQFTAGFAALPSEGFTVTPKALPADALENDQEGTVNGMGITIGYAFDGTTLTLTGIDKPIFPTWGFIWNLVAGHLTAQ